MTEELTFENEYQTQLAFHLQCTALCTMTIKLTFENVYLSTPARISSCGSLVGARLLLSDRPHKGAFIYTRE